MTLYLTVEQVLDIHDRHGGSGPVRDLDVITSAVMRPQAGFEGHDAHPTLMDKGAALLHGLASTQGFEDGNKRTAWIATVVFLDLNGVELPDISLIEAEAFAMAVAVSAWSDRTVAKAAEWLRAQLDTPVLRHDPRVEFAFLARAAVEQEGAFNALGATLATAHSSSLPAPFALAFIARIQWTRADVGTPKIMRITLQPEDGGEPVPGGLIEWPVTAPVQGGHPHHPHGLMPSLILEPLLLLFEATGRYEVLLHVNDHLLARVPLNFVLL